MHTPTETRIVINNHHGLLALCPDVLISPTKVAESCTCTRRGVLSDRIRSFGMSAASAVMGNVRHAFIEELTEKVLDAINELGNPSFSAQDIMNKIPKPVVNQIAMNAIQQHVEDLYCIHKTDEELFQDLYSIIPPTMTWITMCAKEGTLALTVKHPAHANITNDLYKEVNDYKINDIVGIEESICSPVLGIKGQIDMIAGGSISKIRGHTIAQTKRDELVTVPIEFKTGKWRQSTAIAHRAQVILYILLMMMRRSTMRSIEENNGSMIRSSVSSYGLVLYISDRDQKVDFIKPQWHEIKDLMMSRNSLAKSIFSSTHSNNSTNLDGAISAEDGSGLVLLRAPSQASGSDVTGSIAFDNNYLSSNEKNGTITRLPPMLKSDRECSYCYSASECLMYHASKENGNDTSSGISTQFNYVLKGISHKHIQYLKHWDHLIDLESIVNEDSIQRLWSLTGPEREKSGAKSMGRLIMTSVSSSNSLMKVHSVSNGGVSTVGNGNKDHNLLISLSRPDDASEDSPFMVGDRVLVSIEQLSTSKDAENNPQQTQIFSKVLSAINANICSGAIQIITKDTIEIMIVQGHRSILRYVF
jgi:DNA replication ATP-dependent helicase Dna2